MTIAQAFNEITIAQGGTPSTGGTIAGAIDALNDALAGSDQPAANTIEGAIRILGEHIGTGGGGGGTAHGIHCYLVDTSTMAMTPLEGLVYAVPVSDVGGQPKFDLDAKTPAESATAGTIIYADTGNSGESSVSMSIAAIGAWDDMQKFMQNYNGSAFIAEQSPTLQPHMFFMPDCDVTLIYASVEQSGE